MRFIAILGLLAAIAILVLQYPRSSHAAGPEAPGA